MLTALSTKTTQWSLLLSSVLLVALIASQSQLSATRQALSESETVAELAQVAPSQEEVLAPEYLTIDSSPIDTRWLAETVVAPHADLAQLLEERVILKAKQLRFVETADQPQDAWLLQVASDPNFDRSNLVFTELQEFNIYLVFADSWRVISENERCWIEDSNVVQSMNAGRTVVDQALLLTEACYFSANNGTSATYQVYRMSLFELPSGTERPFFDPSGVLAQQVQWNQNSLLEAGKLRHLRQLSINPPGTMTLVATPVYYHGEEPIVIVADLKTGEVTHQITIPQD